MPLTSVEVAGFRNIAGGRIELAPGANYLFGPNGSGKTSLLEALHYLVLGRSFRSSTDRDLIGRDAGLLVVSGSDDNGQHAEVRYDRRSKRLMLNRTRIDRLSDYFGWLSLVVLLPDDINLVRGGAGERRGYVDMAIAKADRSYIRLLSGYRHALQQHNRLLEQGGGHAEHEAWEEELVRTGVPVLTTRGQRLPGLLRAAAAYAEELGGARVTFDYRPSVEPGTETARHFRRRLAETRARSMILQHTLAGPHRDEIGIARDGQDLKRFGSYGEQRLASVALRLAEAAMLAESSGSRPVFLLDEVASELDPGRGRRMFQLVGSMGQLVYAAAREFGHEGKEFRVEAGQITPVAPAG